MPKDGDRRQDDSGWLIYKKFEDDAGGFWVREEDSKRTKYRVPVSCPACNVLLDNWKTSYYHRWGVCNDCYFLFLEGRDNLPNFKNNEERTAYCVEKMAERKKK